MRMIKITNTLKVAPVTAVAHHTSMLAKIFRADSSLFRPTVRSLIIRLRSPFFLCSCPLGSPQLLFICVFGKRGIQWQIFTEQKASCRALKHESTAPNLFQDSATPSVIFSAASPPLPSLNSLENQLKHSLLTRGQPRSRAQISMSVQHHLL